MELLATRVQFNINLNTLKKLSSLALTIQYYKQQIRQIHEQHKTEIIKATKYIRSLEDFSRNREEITVHKILTTLKTALIHQGKINEDEMIILGNAFVPYSSNDQLHTRQIDHLVLMPTGIHIIETKCWQGKVLYGITKEKAKDFSFLLDSLFPNIDKNQEQTVVMVKSQNYDNSEKLCSEMNVKTYGNPAEQITQTAQILKNYLQIHNKEIPIIQSIIYFACDHKTSVINYSSKANPKCFTSKEDLSVYFEKQLDEKNLTYTADELMAIKKIIEDMTNLP
ncbi:NERD domain-containing protein [Priestia megaterium]|nr:NERD domain-containing protein [Priestia megaterium]